MAADHAHGRAGVGARARALPGAVAVAPSSGAGHVSVMMALVYLRS